LEVEAKFSILDERMFRQLLAACSLAGFRLADASVAKFHDQYLDTAGRTILAAGYGCRLRITDGHYLLTVKGLGSASGPIHRRAEYEVELPEPLGPADWPPCPARDLILSLCDDELLLPLFDIEQTRHKRTLYSQGRRIAELSLDHVRVMQGSEEVTTYLELEAELLADGHVADLERLAAELQEGWGLAPQSRSKFERGLGLVGGQVRSEDASTSGQESRLSARERATVEQLAECQEVIARRARLLLAWDEGLSRAEMLERSGLSARRARYWLAAFSQRRLDVFPERVMEELAAGEDAGDLEAPRRTAAPGQVASAKGPVPASPSVELLVTPGIEPDDPMTEAGRKIFRFHFRRMLYHEPGTRLGEDIEPLHDMRVATRRMRAAFRVFGDYYDPDVMASFLKGLRRTGRTLGVVRDLDVFREKVLDYRASLPQSQQASLDGLLAVLETQREAAREQMIDYLDGKKYRRFTESFGEFVETEGMGGLPASADLEEPRPYRVRYVAPVAIHERLAVVRTYGERVDVPHPPLTELHALRIACKKLRYTLEFFSEILGPDTKALVKQVVAVQDHLGNLQDAVVASGILRDFLVWGTWGHRDAHTRQPDLETPVVSPGVAAYLAAKQSELQHLLDTFPEVWQRIESADFSRMFARAVMVL
jgi:CHAD domain-containing protein